MEKYGMAGKIIVGMCDNSTLSAHAVCWYGVRECNFHGVSNEFSSKDALCRTNIKS
jgi:hypothetical protein